MERQYTVLQHNQEIGKVCVTRQGLYYAFHCRCELPADDIFRLTVRSGTVYKKLGVLIPYEGGFGLDTKLPVKEIGEGDLLFSVVRHCDSFSGVFVPIIDEEPFAYISRLKKSFLIIKNGQPGIEIKRRQEYV